MKLKQQANPLAKKKTKNKPNSIKRLIIYCLILSLLTILTPVEIHVLVWFRNPCISLVYETIFLQKLRVSFYTVHHHVFKYLFLSLLFGQKAILQFSLNQCKS